MSNFHHQTANASTNTPIHENMCLSPFITSSMTNKSASIELSPVLSTIKIAGSSLSLTTVNSGTLSNKINKISSNINQQDSSSFNFISRSEISQDSTSLPEKKTLIVSFF